MPKDKMYKDMSDMYKGKDGDSYYAKSMIKEDHSAMSNCPRDVMNKEYPMVAAGGSMISDSVEYSDMLSDNRGRGVKKQSAKTPY